MDEELKPCPFCGGEVNVYVRDGDNNSAIIFGSAKMVRIKCPDCFCDIQVNENCFEDVITFDEMLDYAIEQWNTRAERTCIINPDADFTFCDSCDAMFALDYFDQQWKYCPNCGAKVVKK